MASLSTGICVFCLFCSAGLRSAQASSEMSAFSEKSRDASDAVRKIGEEIQEKPDGKKAVFEKGGGEAKPSAAPASRGPWLAAPTLGRDPSVEAPPSRPVSVYRPSTGARPASRMRRGVRYRDPKSVPQTKVPGAYPWHFDITATVFWIGERPTARNPVPNSRSSWDTAWMENFGGFDTPDPAQRTADFCPKGFRPRLNPFYVALPYNDCVNSRQHKSEAERVIPWFRKEFKAPGSSVCKGKWVQIFYNGNYCFAQWEDCGPFTTEDWPYVFGGKLPANRSNKGAGIDISPAVRDYLGIAAGTASVHWRFVEFNRVPVGPWAKYGENNPFVNPAARPKSHSPSKTKSSAGSPARRTISRRDFYGP